MGTKGTPMLDSLGHQSPPVDLRTLSGTATLGLAPRPESVRRARDFTRSTLHGWRLPEQFDAVALVVSELVTNAVRHGVGVRPTTFDEEGHAYDGGERSAVELELMRCSGRLICAVQDPSAAAPRVGEMDGVAESGRGLHLVECFSDGWGWRALAGERRGKVVWAVFRTGA
ncbi:ATP-binding protein [Streptomyces radicis]|uniref:ATP-binding protein n=2 Tax=Streptomyces radicis TaxID=1750517 RepID=A0A3A9WCQ4_9ACTN|nr:ATP-binding protein [Streptomyces radicis]RKN10083.1 ATP-binding protein [Streptomyces radicis]RKN24425.1 ATP-binding protein [Streptomyces radicis]